MAPCLLSSVIYVLNGPHVLNGPEAVRERLREASGDDLVNRFRKEPGCSKHLILLDARGRCPICCDLQGSPPT